MVAVVFLLFIVMCCMFMVVVNVMLLSFFVVGGVLLLLGVVINRGQGQFRPVSLNTLAVAPTLSPFFDEVYHTYKPNIF